MSEARKCDRCGKLYEQYEKEGNDFLSRFGCSYINSITMINIDKHGRNSRGQLLDVCPECMEQFLKFWNMEDGQGWIPVSAEQIPSECVLACDKTGEVLIGWIHMDEPSSTGFATENEHEIMYNTVAWMPLPEPYKEGE